MPTKHYGTGDTFYALASAQALALSGLSGAGVAVRLAGGTSGGSAPSSGTFSVGDLVIDTSGTIWVCSVAGTPGTWVRMPQLAGTGTAITASRSDHTHTGFPLGLWGGSTVGTTNGSGDYNLGVAICTATGWSSVTGAVVWNGDGVARPSTTIGKTTTGYGNSWNVRVWLSTTGVAVTGSAFRFDWLAWGG